MTPGNVKSWLEHLVTLVTDGYRAAAEENLAVGLEQARRAALRERDAEHEEALAKARKAAIREAVRAGELAWDAEIDRNSGNLPASAIMAALRALLEEAGK